MKFKSLMLSFIVGIFAVFSIFGLAGCGEIKLEEVSNSFTMLEKACNDANVFKTGKCQEMETDYLIDYGTIVDKFVSEKATTYYELNSVYNIMLAISCEYIDSNKNYLLNFDEKKMDKKVKSCLQELNDSIAKYIKSIDSFKVARRSLIEYFENQVNEETDQVHLRKFKKFYGNLVSKNIEIASNLAKTIEATEIFEILKKTEPTENDSRIIKQYIRAKMLPIFSTFKIDEIENKLNWSAQTETETKTRITNIMNNLDEEFDKFKTNFVDLETKKLTSNEINELFDYINVFLSETDSYYNALKNLDISKLSIEFDNNLEKYKKENGFAEIYLQKLEQFVGVTLPNFADGVLAIVNKI